MSTPPLYRFVYRVEARPLIRTDWKRVPVWNPKREQWEAFMLRRGKWYTAHRRLHDGRAVFTAGEPGSTQRWMPLAHAAKLTASLTRHGFATRMRRLRIARYPHLRGDMDCSAKMLRALEAIAVDAGGIIIDIVSGGRTYAEQSILYQLWLDGRGNLAAKPGQSNHETLRAADAYVDGAPLQRYLRNRGIEYLATRHGVSFPVRGEEWHAEVAA